MKTSFAVVALCGAGALVTACTAPMGDALTQPDLDTVAAANKKAGAPKLVLSHIECAPDGSVEVHFVLLFAGSATPGTLTGTYNGGAFSIEPGKNSGNVWHYTTYFAAGEIDIYSASVEAKGTTASLHNPSEYAGNYYCGDAPSECPVTPEPADVLCTDTPLGNPGAECAYFGLVPQGKDDNLSGLTYTATQDAYLALVKSGTRGCEAGSSAYRVYVNVSEGDTLSTPVDQGISHVTYCACPEE
jgi:hypothetical protein